MACLVTGLAEMCVRTRVGADGVRTGGRVLTGGRLLSRVLRSKTVDSSGEIIFQRRWCPQCYLNKEITLIIEANDCRGHTLPYSKGRGGEMIRPKAG